jgi:hypothetical protein
MARVTKLGPKSTKMLADHGLIDESGTRILQVWLGAPPGRDSLAPSIDNVLAHYRERVRD